MKLFLNLIFCLFIIFGCDDVPRENNQQVPNSGTPVVRSNVDFGNNWEWLTETCSRIQLGYNKDGDGVVSYSILANFYSKKKPIGASGIYVSDSSFDRVLYKAVQEVQKKL
ncbi:MAG TPA: hypothetical protein VMZ91_03405 [Candidatus Paceibacterota bacterium]|nr:hypothetical protein [Candidatus Paceibacterota bacterium]